MGGGCSWQMLSSAHVAGEPLRPPLDILFYLVKFSSLVLLNAKYGLRLSSISPYSLTLYLFSLTGLQSRSVQIFIYIKYNLTLFITTIIACFSLFIFSHCYLYLLLELICISFTIYTLRMFCSRLTNFCSSNKNNLLCVYIFYS